jgi:hypothetical protein
MSLIGPINLNQQVLNLTLGQGQDTQATATTAAPTTNKNDSATAVEDQFTSSAQTGQNQDTAEAAGLFQVGRTAIFSAAAQFLLTQTNPPAQNTVPPPTRQPAAANISAAPSQEAAATVIINKTPVTLAAPATAPLASNATNPIILNTATPASAAGTPAPTTAGSPAAAPLATTAAASTNVAATQAQLQALNSSLAALGLPASDFAQIDQIASIINDFNPVAFSAQVTQLEATAQTTPQEKTTANAAATSSAAGNAKPVGG